MAAVARHVLSIVEGTGDEQRGQPEVTRRDLHAEERKSRRGCRSAEAIMLAAAP